MPYVEQENLQNLIDFQQPLMVGTMGKHTLNPAQADAAKTPLDLLLCRSDGQEPIFTGYMKGTWAGGNYVVNEGTGLGTTWNDSLPTDGVFWQGSNVRLAHLCDGTSNTLLMSETLLGLGFNTTDPSRANPDRMIAQMPKDLRHGTNDLHSVFMALKIATSLQAKGAKVTLFADLEGVRLVDSRQPLNLRWGAGKDTVGHYYEHFVQEEGEILVCPHCAQAAGISEKMLREGAMLTNKEQITDTLFKADKVIDY